MAKKFCTTGTCIPEKNYMVDLSNRIQQIINQYIESGQYLRSIEPDNMVRQPCFIFWKRIAKTRLSGFEFKF